MKGKHYNGNVGELVKDQLVPLSFPLTRFKSLGVVLLFLPESASL